MKETWMETINYLVLLERLERSLIEIHSEATQKPATFGSKSKFYYVVLNQEKSGIYRNKKCSFNAHQQQKGTIHSRFETLEEACSFYQHHAKKYKPLQIFNVREQEYWDSYIRSINRIHRKAKENKEQLNQSYYVVIDGEQTGIFTSEKTAIQYTKSKKNAYFNKCITLEEASETFAKVAFHLTTTELIRLNPVRIKDFEDSIEAQIKDAVLSIERITKKTIKKELDIEKAKDPLKKMTSPNKKTKSIETTSNNDEVYYAVRIGKRPGIYKALPLTHKQVLGYPNADYRRFPTFEEALSYLEPDRKKVQPRQAILSPNAFENEQSWHFYVDGSFSYQNGNASYGITIHQPKGVLFDGGIIHDPMHSKSSQGTEFYACMRALELAVVNKCKSIFIYYDNEDTGRVARGQKDNMSTSEQLLLSYVEKTKLLMEIQFIKIKSHSYVEPHNQADEVANNVRMFFGEFSSSIEIGAEKSFFVNSKKSEVFSA